MVSAAWPTEAAAARPAAKTPAPPAGWVVDRVRIEPLGDAVVGIDGLGAYRGALDLVPAGAAGVGVVNELGLDDYLKGLAEVPGSWPVEALKAQAVAARTYALYGRARPVATAARALGADICATDACQVYAGLAKEQSPAGAAWAAAVEATAGRVLLYRNEPILAKYSSSNGGRTVPGGKPYLRAAPDPDDARSPLHRWRSTLPAADVVAALGLPPEAVLVAARRTEASEVLLGIAGPEGSTVALPALTAVDFRARLNEVLPPPEGLPKPVPSMQYVVAFDAAAGTVVIDGRGWGHGIGLSQWGAMGKAARGMTADDILAAYYAGIRPTAAAPNTLPATIKVAVDVGRPTATVAASGAFRVLDGSGAPVAVVASGPWQVVPASGGRLRVVPPVGQDGVPSLHSVGVKPALAVQAGTAPALSFALSAPSSVEVALHAPDTPGPAVVSAGRVVGSGTVTQALPALDKAGRYTVTVTADAGAGRRTVVSVPLDVVAPAPSAADEDATTARGFPARLAAADRPPGFTATAGAAALALLLAGAALVASAAPGLGRTSLRRLH
ncbi:MAG TPA: SpoIID/LytB domain-containing protein [Acidimicrobiales bacterium]